MSFQNYPPVDFIQSTYPERSMGDLRNENNTFFYIIIGIIVVILLIYVCVFRKRKNRTGSLLDTNIVNITNIVKSPNLVLLDQHKELLGVAPVQRMKSNVGLMSISQNFPNSPIMPHLNIIDGVSPYNPDYAGKEWADTSELKNEGQGITATTSSTTPILSKALYVQA